MKVFWSRCGHGYGNFGDKLTPLFLDLLKIRYEWAPPEKADLIGIGSLLEKIPDNYNGVVWSTGSMYQTPKALPNATILAVRGKLTLENLTEKRRIFVLGDGGLLCHILTEPTAKKFKLGIIPHFVDQHNTAVREFVSRHSNICYIDICAPTFDVIQQVAACENIISSSLHGLILADSLEVPNRWVEFSSSAAAIAGAGFKFRDYYSAFGLQSIQPMHVAGSESLETFSNSFDNYSRPGIDDMKRDLLDSLRRLATHFGGSSEERMTLDNLRRQEQEKSAGRGNWNVEVSHIVTLLEKRIPAKERFVIIDEDQIRSEVIHAPAIPLIEKDGEYWGAPLDDRHAIQEARRHRDSGIEHIAVTKAAFWWLEEYPEFQQWLNDNAVIVYNDNVLTLFRLS